MSIKENRSILNQVLGNKLSTYFAPQNTQGGLLNFVRSPMASDLGIGLLAQSGYQTMPTSTGQIFGNAFRFADDRQRQRRTDDLADIGTLASLSNALKPDVFQRDTTKDLFVDNELVEKGVPKPVLPKSTDFFNMVNPETKETKMINLRDPADLAFLNSDASIGFIKTGVQATTEGLEKVDPVGERNLATSYENSVNLINNLGLYQEQLMNPNVTTGSIATNVNALVTNIKTEINDLQFTFVKNNKSDISEPSDILDNADTYLEQNFGDQIKESAIETGLLKSMIIQIGYDYAKANNKDGRISEQDFKKGVEILMAGGIKDKDGLAKNAQRLAKIQLNNFDTSYNSFITVEGLGKDNKYSGFKDSITSTYDSYFKDNQTQTNTTSNISGETIINLDNL